jgi:hypothetical protein
MSSQVVLFPLGRRSITSGRILSFGDAGLDPINARVNDARRADVFNRSQAPYVTGWLCSDQQPFSACDWENPRLPQMLRCSSAGDAAWCRGRSGTNRRLGPDIVFALWRGFPRALDANYFRMVASVHGTLSTPGVVPGLRAGRKRLCFMQALVDVASVRAGDGEIERA